MQKQEELGLWAKIHGCRVIGSAGSAEKVWFLREECGFDGAFRLFEGKNVDKMVVRLA